jgi:glycosyltransferase involved in cell wall biosynthesis
LESAGLVSIVIVAHDNWPDLQLAIQSALHQSYRPIEVIVVDNSSTDATSTLVPELYGGQLCYLRQPNTGEGGGRNTGFRLAKGDFVQFLDGDDFLAPDKVEKQVAMLMAAPGVDVVYGDVRQFQTDAGPASWEDWDNQDYEDMLATLLSPEGNGAGLIPTSVIFRRSALERVGPWIESAPNSSPHVGSDQEYWLRAAWSGCRFRYCPGSLSLYRRRSRQLSSNPHDRLRTVEAAFACARTYITEEPYRSVLARRFAHILFYLAVSDRQLDRSTARAKLEEARQMSPALQFPTGSWIEARRVQSSKRPAR